MKRVAVVGSGGAGKTTFAAELGRLTGLPVIHLDQIHWKPGWVGTPKEEWARIQAESLSGDRWIVDGNYAGTFDLRFARADTIVILALSRTRCLQRVLRRTLTNYGRAVQADGCREHFDWSFLRWVWRYRSVSRPALDAALRAVPTRTTVVELTTPRQIRGYLDTVAQRG